MPAFVACNENKAAFAKKQLRLSLAGQERVWRRRQVDFGWWVLMDGREQKVGWRGCEG